jgi:stearoyl-CoA desaturase (Delta-9 desaturase)
MPDFISRQLHTEAEHRWDYLTMAQFASLHVGCLLVFWAGVSWVAIAACLTFYCVRIFAMSAGYHRYFAHRSYKTSRAFQFLLALLGVMSYQKGPLWWAAHHRYHHLHADREDDIHSPSQHGFWWAHCGWIFSLAYRETNMKLVSNFKRYPELRWLDNFYPVPSIVAATAIFLFGVKLDQLAPNLHTSGLQMLTWGFFISTVLVHHAIFSANSIGHTFGTRRFHSHDDSRNNLFVALLTFGDGWHNNHHYYGSSARHGFYWWEIDLTHYILRGLSRIGIVWDLHTPPERIYAAAEHEQRIARVG